MMTSALQLIPKPLTRDAFAPFGQVIEGVGNEPEQINYGNTKKWADLARVDTGDGEGRPCVSLFEGSAVQLPLRIEILERHPLSSQAFIPLHDEPFLLIVARAGDVPKHEEVQAFITNGKQGINYHKGTWHHYLVAPVDGARFLIIDRAGPGKNCDECTLDRPLVIEPMII